MSKLGDAATEPSSRLARLKSRIPPALLVFAKFACVGLCNTGLHWLVFYLLFSGLGLTQSFANLGAFAIAVTFSYFANARFTFQSKATFSKYLAYVGVLGALAFAIGLVADRSALPPIVTLISFSAISLGVGFLYSRFIVFRQPA